MTQSGGRSTHKKRLKLQQRYKSRFKLYGYDRGFRL